MREKNTRMIQRDLYKQLGNGSQLIVVKLDQSYLSNQS